MALSQSTSQSEWYYRTLGYDSFCNEKMKTLIEQRPCTKCGSDIRYIGLGCKNASLKEVAIAHCDQCGNEYEHEQNK
jgi:hypothetical protein